MISQSLKMDVLGRPRNKPVPLPAVIKGGKPGAIPNTKVCRCPGYLALKKSDLILECPVFCPCFPVLQSH